MLRAVMNTDELLVIATHKVRLLTEPDALGLVSASTLRRLVRSKLMVAIPTLIYSPLVDVSIPLDLWRPGDPRLDAGSLSYRAQKRFRGLGTRVTRLYVATELAARRTGGVGHGRLPQGLLSASHDAHMYSIYKALPADSQRAWVSEDILRGERWRDCSGKLPDAFIEDSKLAIDFISQYPPSRVRELLAFAYAQKEISIALF